MSAEELKKLDASTLQIAKLITIISKAQTNYLNHKLESFKINTTQAHLLFEIDCKDNLNQEKIAQRCNINKGAVARSIKKLEEKGFVLREIDENNRRQNKVSLTQKGKETLDECINLLDYWESEVFSEDIIEKSVLQNVLKDIAIKTIELSEKGD